MQVHLGIPNERGTVRATLEGSHDDDVLVMYRPDGEMEQAIEKHPGEDYWIIDYHRLVRVNALRNGDHWDIPDNVFRIREHGTEDNEMDATHHQPHAR